MDSRSLFRFLTSAFAAVAMAIVSAAAEVFPDAEWTKAGYAEAGLAEARLQQARDYALGGGGSGIITRHGKVVMTWGDQAKLYDLKSSSKSIGVTLLGIALKDGKVQLDDPAVR
jgi:CubicO group peptidase (beta-lactamase class C family)